jgi:glucose-6-phosphate dehydrogenase assembly protein OpcA
MFHGARTMTAEEERTRLIGEIVRVLRDGPVPEEARAAALTFIGWLARRMPGEPISHCDIRRCKGVHMSLAMDPSYEGPPSGSKPRGEYPDGSEYRASSSRPQSAR